MKALRWHGTTDIRCDSVPDPEIEHPRDAIIKVTSCAICGSDLHLYDHFMPGMKKGDIMGHEFMGEVVDVGAEAKSALKIGDRIVVPFTITCGDCEQCKRGNFSVCERSNRNKDIGDKVFGHTTAGLFGYTHLTGVAGVTLLDAICAQSLSVERKAKRSPMRDYRRRSGFPRAPEAMRGAAKDFKVPPDMRTPEALQPYPGGGTREKLAVARSPST